MWEGPVACLSAPEMDRPPPTHHTIRGSHTHHTQQGAHPVHKNRVGPSPITSAYLTAANGHQSKSRAKLAAIYAAASVTRI